jgi:hypothetical protein
MYLAFAFLIDASAFAHRSARSARSIASQNFLSIRLNSSSDHCPTLASNRSSLSRLLGIGIANIKAVSSANYHGRQDGGAGAPHDFHPTDEVSPTVP